MARSGAQTPVFIKGDVLSPGALPVSGKFDIIVSNPPYVMESEKTLMRSNVLDHEPSLALFVSDEDPLIFYRAVAQIACERLSDNGLCMVEINEALGEETAELFTTAGFPDTKIVKDLNDRDRFVMARR
jgi:release factor glutamine methyltransferase